MVFFTELFLHCFVNGLQLYKSKQYCGACKRVWLPNDNSSFVSIWALHYSDHDLSRLWWWIQLCIWLTLTLRHFQMTKLNWIALSFLVWEVWEMRCASTRASKRICLQLSVFLGSSSSRIALLHRLAACSLRQVLASFIGLVFFKTQLQLILSLCLQAQCDKCEIWIHADCDKLTNKKLKVIDMLTFSSCIGARCWLRSRFCCKSSTWCHCHCTHAGTVLFEAPLLRQSGSDWLLVGLQFTGTFRWGFIHLSWMQEASRLIKKAQSSWEVYLYSLVWS